MGHRIFSQPGRLALLDQALHALETPLLKRRDGPWAQAPIVDVGIGVQPWTTLELAESVAPLRVIGVDHSEELVRRARRMQSAQLSFLCGSFALPVDEVRLIRMMNVLRDGPAEAVDRAHDQLADSLLEGGLLVEGSCAPGGEAGTAHWLRKGPAGLIREGLLLWLDGGRGRHPMVFARRLPQDLQHDATHPIHPFLRHWTDRLEQQAPGPDRLVRAAESVDGLRAVPLPDGVAFLLDGQAPALQV